MRDEAVPIQSLSEFFWALSQNFLTSPSIERAFRGGLLLAQHS
jgi:hypothetical protein